MNAGPKPIDIPVTKPRNPLVAPSIKRKAGKHRDKKREEKNNPSDH